MTPAPATLDAILAGRKFVPVLPQSAENDAEKLTLDEGDVFIGTLTDVFEFDSKFKKDTKVKGYNLTTLKGDPVVLIQKGNLAWHMGPVKPGQLVQITRLPDDTLDNGMVSSSWAVDVAE